MKRIIASLIAGLILGTAATGTAATVGWRYMANEVKCKGGTRSVVCYSDADENVLGRDYTTYISRCSVEVWRSRYDGTQDTVFSRWQPYCN